MLANYSECYKAVRKFEGGNDDDPQDPGGRTSRGIIQREWTAYCKTHPGRPADVWQAPEADVEEIYRVQYWDAQRCNELPSGVDETIFDYGVNSGIGRAPKVLRRCLHMADNAPMASVIARLNELTPAQITALIHAVNDERLMFLRGLRHWTRFGNGWGKRVATVRAISLQLQRQPAGGMAVPPIAVTPTAGKGEVPEPKAAKNATTGAATAAAGGTLWMWIGTHPYLSGMAAIAILVGIGFAINAITRAHRKKQDEAPEGWKPPAKLKQGNGP